MECISRDKFWEIYDIIERPLQGDRNISVLSVDGFKTNIYQLSTSSICYSSTSDVHRPPQCTPTKAAGAFLFPILVLVGIWYAAGCLCSRGSKKEQIFWNEDGGFEEGVSELEGIEEYIQDMTSQPETDDANLDTEDVKNLLKNAERAIRIRDRQIEAFEGHVSGGPEVFKAFRHEISEGLEKSDRIEELKERLEYLSDAYRILDEGREKLLVELQNEKDYIWVLENKLTGTGEDAIPSDYQRLEEENARLRNELHNGKGRFKKLLLKSLEEYEALERRHRDLETEDRRQHDAFQQDSENQRVYSNPVKKLNNDQQAKLTTEQANTQSNIKKTADLKQHLQTSKQDSETDKTLIKMLETNVSNLNHELYLAQTAQMSAEGEAKELRQRLIDDREEFQTRLEYAQRKLDCAEAAIEGLQERVDELQQGCLESLDRQV
ncbi:hypothetical protein GQ44DRAFT_813771 [Phaeosphaeriaceae sp. PMI808]|nr:hypothetical protein GQ44DRAFT_813771 [Phaeosphaeriaceae sp. PMI808]